MRWSGEVSGNGPCHPGRLRSRCAAANYDSSNTFSATQNFSIRRRERDSNAVKEVVSDSGIVDWSHADGYITFSLELNPKESALIRITYRETVSPAPEDETALYRLKTAARRHLCEARDNYLQPALNVLGVLR